MIKLACFNEVVDGRLLKRREALVSFEAMRPLLVCSEELKRQWRLRARRGEEQRRSWLVMAVNIHSCRVRHPGWRVGSSADDRAGDGAGND